MRRRLEPSTVPDARQLARSPVTQLSKAALCVPSRLRAVVCLVPGIRRLFVSSTIRVRLTSIVVVALVATLMFGVLASPALAKTKKKKHRRNQSAYSVRVIRRVARRYKYSKAEVNALIKLAYRESSYNPRCITGSYRGLFQIRTTSKKWSSPWWNTARAIRDIKGVYKTPRRALAHSYSHGWY
jgi:hypothetical protein